jgi:DNA repair ATPase RecN
MFIDINQELILMTIGAFLLGWVLSSISSRMGDRHRARRRDPRDDRIRELEAEVRIANTEREQLREKLETAVQELEDANDSIEKRDNVISHQQSRVEELKRDLKESVAKTRELRQELTDRAEETLRSEVKIREIETELSVAQASTDMIATGVLDYSMAPDAGDAGANDLVDPDELVDPDAKEAGSAKP